MTLAKCGYASGNQHLIEQEICVIPYEYCAHNDRLVVPRLSR